MTNHVHLLLTAERADSCAMLMKSIGQLYSQYFNKAYERCGSLWEGRFKSCLVQSESYVLACYRYIELNPVRAGMVGHPAAYFWSSYAANSGARHDPSLEPHAEFVALSANPDNRRAAYRGLFAEEMDDATVEAIRKAANSGYPLVSDAFKNSVIAPLGWKMEREKPGPRLRAESVWEFEPGIAALTPN
jgi:putative transposase